MGWGKENPAQIASVIEECTAMLVAEDALMELRRSYDLQEIVGGETMPQGVSYEDDEETHIYVGHIDDVAIHVILR